MKQLRFLKILLVAAALIALLASSCGPPTCRTGQGGFYEIAPIVLSPEDSSYMLSVARGLLYGPPAPRQPEQHPALFEQQRRPLVVSVALGKRQALVAHGDNENLYESLVDACGVIERLAQEHPLDDGWIRIDVVNSTEGALQWGPQRKYDYDLSSRGLIFDTDPLMIFTPLEVLSRHLMGDDGRRKPNAFKNYLTDRQYGKIMNDCLDGTVGGVEFTFATFIAFSEDPQDHGRLVTYQGLQPADRQVTPESLRLSCVRAGEYLVASVNERGKFIYNYRPQLDKEEDSYNLLRHAGTVYSMMELYQITGDQRLKDKAALALGYLMDRVEPIPYNGATYHAVVNNSVTRTGERRQVIKLGGNGLAVVAICKYSEVSGDRSFLPQAKQLAEYIMAAQEADGHFVSKFDLESGADEDFDSAYYPGEAMLGLIRLNQLAPDPRYIPAVQRGMDWLINVRDKEITDARLLADHWLMIGLNELYRIAPDELYLKHMSRLADSIVDKQLTQGKRPELIGVFSGRAESAPSATRAEGLVAACRLADYAGLDGSRWLKALDLSAGFQLRCQFDEFNSIHLRYPYKAQGGFMGGFEDFDIRIDYVQHDISSLLGLYKLMSERADPQAAFPWDVTPGHRYPQPAAVELKPASNG